MPEDIRPPLLPLPSWAAEMIDLYQSHAANQFLLHGNVHDRFLLPLQPQPRLGSLADFLRHILMPGFDVILSYDLGQGLRVEKGGEQFTQWPAYKEEPQFPREPGSAVSFLNRYFRYIANLAALGRPLIQVGCWIRAADLLVPAQFHLHHELHAMALILRDWATDDQLTRHSIATVLISDNLNDLHPLLVNNPRTAPIKIPLPDQQQLAALMPMFQVSYPKAVGQSKLDSRSIARLMSGLTLSAVENLFKRKEYQGRPLGRDDLVQQKKVLVEQECNGLIEFVAPSRTLADFHGCEPVKQRLKDDITLWNKNELRALPMGYLVCGPVGTGKTFFVECLAGEAGVPVVKLKNFRDRWVGSTEGNLETIFRLLHALGRCVVFIDEADQALGRRSASDHDAGLSGRVYSMFAQEMSRPENRGKVLWILATSRPDLVEVDLKRPGRVDVKIPLLPTISAHESLELLSALCQRLDVALDPRQSETLKPLIPVGMTPGAAEALAIKVYRLIHTRELDPVRAVRESLTDYRHPVAPEILEKQIRLAVQESTDIAFVPEAYRPYLES